MSIFLAVIGIGVLIRTFFTAHKQRLLDRQVRQLSREDAHKQLIDRIDSNFRKLGWTEWDRSVHEAKGQEDQIRRAIYHPCKVLAYDPKTGVAIVMGTEVYSASGHRCNCPDYARRGLPCKHMYTLATALIDGDVPIKPKR